MESPKYVELFNFTLVLRILKDIVTKCHLIWSNSAGILVFFCGAWEFLRGIVDSVIFRRNSARAYSVWSCLSVNGYWSVNERRLSVIKKSQNVHPYYSLVGYLKNVNVRGIFG